MSKSKLPDVKPDANGYYRLSFSHEGKQYSVRSKNLMDACKKLALKQQAVINGEESFNSNTTVERWALEWLETYKNVQRGTKSYADYLSRIQNRIIPAIGARRIKDIKEIDLQNIMNSVEGMSESYAKKLMMTIKQIFWRARKNGLVRTDVSECITLPNVSKGTHRTITESERKHIMDTIPNHVSGLWVLTILCTGMRPGETAALQWTDIDFSKRIIHVTKAMQSGSNQIKTPKTDASIRDLPIPDMLYSPLLSAHRARKSIYVFTQQKSDKPHTEESLRCYWKSFVRALDIAMGAKVYRNQIISSKVSTDLTPYCLRHTFCTDLQDAGVPINIAKYLMGHSDISVTAKIYTHHSKLATANAVTAINKYYIEQLNMSPDMSPSQRKA